MSSSPTDGAPGDIAPGDGAPGAQVSPQWAEWRRRIDLAEYESRFTDDGAHGEADLVESLLRARGGRSALDAGCGTGRLAIELARRGFDVAGVDLDADMVELGRGKAPQLTWDVADLATLDLGRTFDVVVMAGNVVLFCRTEDRAAVVARCAAHVAPGGLLVAGFSLRGISPDEYDAACTAAGLTLVDRWSTWGRAAYVPGGDYAVSLHTPR